MNVRVLAEINIQEKAVWGYGIFLGHTTLNLNSIFEISPLLQSQLQQPSLGNSEIIIAMMFVNERMTRLLRNDESTTHYRIKTENKSFSLKSIQRKTTIVLYCFYV